MSDPVADMLTRIRNAQMSRKKFVSIPFSNLKFAIAHVLKDEGYIEDYSSLHASAQKSCINIVLKYYAGRPVIELIKRISRPGFRVYKKAVELPRIMNGFGIAIVSTSRGVMTDGRARRDQVGGEVLCAVA